MFDNEIKQRLAEARDLEEVAAPTATGRKMDARAPASQAVGADPTTNASSSTSPTITE